MSTAIIDDSFSRDLLKLFDKKRSRIHFELGLADVEPSPESSLISIPPLIRDESPHVNIVEKTTNRRRAASDLLRRSSAYLKAKLNSFKHRSQDHLHQPPDPFADAKRSTLKEYPPKPLVYAPIDPIPDEPESKTLLHRISVPLFNKTTCHPFRERRLSMPDIKQKMSKKKKKNPPLE